MNTSLCVALVAGESSGDILGASLMRALRAKHGAVDFIGVGGPLMEAEGLQSLFPLERLSVMGVVDVLKQLPDLLQARKQVINAMLKARPDVFVGIDAPDFTIPIEARLKQAGLTTVHYVSPSVWAWRQKRVFKIKAATHRVLCLLPFEKQFYDRFHVPATFVGHTLADEIPLQPDREAAQHRLGLATDRRYVGLLPGSRRTEVELLSEPFIQAALELQQRYDDIEFVVPLVNPARRAYFEDLLERKGQGLKIHLFDGQSRDVMSASHSLMLASGTVSLEAMLLKRPMVVAYKFSWLNYHMLRWLVKVPHFSLPNLLADDAMVPELLQDEVTPERLVTEVAKHLEEPQTALIERFYKLHESIQCNAADRAASAVLETWQAHKDSKK
ncbi:lipid-A-disaccharide synthase [Aliidiomarina sp. Khilg15.8]